MPLGMQKNGPCTYPRNNFGKIVRWCYRVPMRTFLFAILLTVIIAGVSKTADASWLIDADRFHVSVHGRLSCRDCHEDITATSPHPNPADVNKSPADFFAPASCAACHEDAAAEIAGGHHAGQSATPWQQFSTCIECHNAHYQLSSSEDLSEADLDQPRAKKCSLCHDYQPELPGFSDEDQACLQCHLAFTGDDHRQARKVSEICLHCHSSDRKSRFSPFESYPLIDYSQYTTTSHKDVACMVCHPQSMAFGHGNQIVAECRQCHLPHDEKVSNDAHMNVACEACHLNSIVPVRNHGTGRVEWRKIPPTDRISDIHQLQIPAKPASCRNCHNKTITIGAAAMVLPAKSIVCMSCHTATLTVGDPITSLSLVLFLFGLAVVGSVWFSAGPETSGGGRKLLQIIRAVFSTVFSNRLPAIAKSFVLDGLLQRRLFIVSKSRWLWHALIFYPFIFRFAWGLSALCASLWWPGWAGTSVLLDKNNPATAFLFDLSGMMIILGAAGMIGRRLLNPSLRKVTNLPLADWPAYVLLGSIMIAGFILEGMRMAMTGSPGGASICLCRGCDQPLAGRF